MFWILYRDPIARVTTLAETDDWTDAARVLRSAAVSHGVDLLDYSDTLNDTLHTLLVGVKLFEDEPVREAA